MRKIVKSIQNNQQEWKPPTLRIHMKAAVYARRSDPAARKKETDKSQSREMQTEDLLEWATGKSPEHLNPCWREEYLEPYFADLGLSGTLRPDERPDMLRLFEDIDRNVYNHGSVICFQESRLFRDETQIYYNQFIKKCKDHDVVVVAVSPYLMIYDFQDEFLTEMFRWKCKEAGEFIKRQVKGWMLPARDRAAKQGMWAGLGDIAIGYVVDIDPKSPTYKKFLVYEPHAKIVRRLFMRYMELSGNLAALIRELTLHPVIFPTLSEEEQEKYYLKNGIMRKSGGRLSTRAAIESILTNRTYVGWRIVGGQVVKKDSHAAIVDEDLLNFALMRLTGYDIHGNEVTVEPKTKRYYRTIPERAALLKDVVASETGRVYVKMLLDKTTRKYTYVPDGREHGFWRVGHIEMIDIEKLDRLIVERLLFHASHLKDLPGYDEIIIQKREEKKRAIAQIKESIDSIPIEQQRVRRQMRKTENEQVRDMLLKDIEDMEQEKQRLNTVKERLEQELAHGLGNLDEELQLLAEHWNEYPFEKRIALLNFLIHEVSLDMMSPRWLRIRIVWTRDDWGAEEMFLLREEEKAPRWTVEELDYLETNLLTASKDELMERLDTRTWQAIRNRGYMVGIVRYSHDRSQKYGKGESPFSVRDFRFMSEQGIDSTSTCTDWAALSILR
jgi:hypothetical protein